MLWMTGNTAVLVVVLVLLGTAHSHAGGPAQDGRVGTARRGGGGPAKLVCYYWMSGQAYSGPLPPPLNVSLCTHILFLGSNAVNGAVVPGRPTDVGMYYEKVALMKTMNPDLKVILSNGCEFGPILASPANRTGFAESSVPLLRKYGFDGFDLDWEFPNLPQQRENFTLIMQAFRQVYEAEARESGLPRLTISAAVGSTPHLVKACYDIPGLAKYVDFINLMTYDIHGFNRETPFTGFNSPLYSGKSLLDRTVFLRFNMAWAAGEWVRLGLRPEQLIVGIPIYGHTFNLTYSKFTSLYAPALGVYKTLGDEISFPAICGLLAGRSTSQVWDPDCQVPYLYNDDNLWVSYDDVRSVTLKAEFIVSSGYGGAMTYSLNSDDLQGSCDGRTRWPLHLAISQALRLASN